MTFPVTSTHKRTILDEAQLSCSQPSKRILKNPVFENLEKTFQLRQIPWKFTEFEASTPIQQDSKFLTINQLSWGVILTLLKVDDLKNLILVSHAVRSIVISSGIVKKNPVFESMRPRIRPSDHFLSRFPKLKIAKNIMADLLRLFRDRGHYMETKQINSIKLLSDVMMWENVEGKDKNYPLCRLCSSTQVYVSDPEVLRNFAKFMPNNVESVYFDLSTTVEGFGKLVFNGITKIYNVDFFDFDAFPDLKEVDICFSSTEILVLDPLRTYEKIEKLTISFVKTKDPTNQSVNLLMILNLFPNLIELVIDHIMLFEDDIAILTDHRYLSIKKLTSSFDRILGEAENSFVKLFPSLEQMYFKIGDWADYEIEDFSRVIECCPRLKYFSIECANDDSVNIFEVKEVNGVKSLTYKTTTEDFFNLSVSFNYEGGIYVERLE